MRARTLASQVQGFLVRVSVLNLIFSIDLCRCDVPFPAYRRNFTGPSSAFVYLLWLEGPELTDKYLIAMDAWGLS